MILYQKQTSKQYVICASISTEQSRPAGGIECKTPCCKPDTSKLIVKVKDEQS